MIAVMEQSDEIRKNEYKRINMYNCKEHLKRVFVIGMFKTATKSLMELGFGRFIWPTNGIKYDKTDKNGPRVYWDGSYLIMIYNGYLILNIEKMNI